MSDPIVSLRAKDAAGFRAWHEAAVASYAADLEQAYGRPLEEALAKAAADFAELLPDGQDSTGNWVLSIVLEDGTDVGTLWIGPQAQRDGRGFVYDLFVEPAHRRRGYARAAMRAGEELARTAGMTALGLNVFGFNDGALALYRGLGYRVLASQLTKAL